MKVFQDCITLTREDFDENGHYNGPFELACLVNADVEIAADLGSVHFPNNGKADEGGLCTNGRILIRPGTDICVHGPLCAKKLISHGDIYCTSVVEIVNLKCKGKLISEMEVRVSGDFYVGGRIVTPRLKLACMDIQMPQRYYLEARISPKKG